MLRSLQEVKELSLQYGVSEEEILLIAFNLNGVKSSLDFPRIRLNMSIVSRPEEVFYFGVANRETSCFELVGKKLYFSDNHIGNIVEIENDDCASSYFRKNKKVITLNSNTRSTCTGCGFCPNNLELNSEDNALDTYEKLIVHFKKLMFRANYSDMSQIERVTVCTGCFESEKLAVSHLLLVNSVLQDLSFDGVLHYIGSEIVSNNSFELIKNEVSKFMITLTVECFSNRNFMLKDTKSALTLELYEDIAKKCILMGFDTNIIYILGLDSMSEVIEGIERFSKVTNYFPSINLFQPHIKEHEKLVSKEASNIEYYLQIRNKIQEIYNDKFYRPKSWECYRPLWYFNFGDEELNCIRI